MANAYTSGPVPIYVGIGAGSSPSDNAPYFLGWFENGLSDFHIDPKFVPVMSDVFGPALVWDKLFVGEDGWCAGDLTVWNESVYARLAARPSHQTSPVRGALGAADIGTLMVTESKVFPVWLPFPYSTKTTPMPNQPAGYHFPAGIMEGPDGIVAGTRAGKRRVIFYFFSVRNSSDGTIKLYDHDMSNGTTTSGLLLAVPPSASTGALS